MWLSAGAVSCPPPPPIPPLLTGCTRVQRSQRHRQPWSLGTKSCWVIKCEGCLEQFLCEKEPLMTEHIYPIKVGMGHQAGIPTLNQGKQPAGLLAGEGDLGWGTGKADRKPLRKQEYGSRKWPSLQMSRDVAGYLGGALWRWPQEPLVSKGCFRACPRGHHSWAGWSPVGLRNQERQPIPCENGYAFKSFPKVGTATKFSGEKV